jgi:hypothetical protein
MPIPSNTGMWRPRGEARKLLLVSEHSSSRMLKMSASIEDCYLVCLVYLVFWLSGN